ncbi:MAG: hypothetical protein M1827_000074 [Pycnora praestabilis]|nr:MAG: hypothetical protein M1827_000074 [Pycnora praestabilis]
MGANQSSTDYKSGGSDPQKKSVADAKTCYYEILGIERQAVDDEIKKAYRKKAFELHPDRNYGNVEDTTKLFAEVQAAYEVLSDPQERAWYDSHRDAILRDDDDAIGQHYEHNVQITTADDILRMFVRFNGRIDFSNSPTSFFGVLRGTFDTLSSEEEAACDWECLDPIQYPSFGHASDSYEDVVRPFYAAWGGFATKKTFSWKDVYRYSEAPDRKVRRMMEKENKRFRDQSIKEFNEAVRSMVAFARKRDPRYYPNTLTEEERQRSLKNAAAAQAARSRAANQVKIEDHVPPEWSKNMEPVQEDDNEEEDDYEVQQYECVACRKTFKSENQFEVHEKSKKHQKSIQRLRREMQNESKALNLDEHTNEAMATSGSADRLRESTDSNVHPTTLNRAVDGIQNSSAPPEEPASAPEYSNNSLLKESMIATSASENSDDDYASREEVQGRITGDQDSNTGALSPKVCPHQKLGSLVTKFAASSINEDDDTPPRPKIGKAKAKRAKKAAQQDRSEQSDGVVR